MTVARRFLMVVPVVAFVLVGRSSEVWAQQLQGDQKAQTEIPVCTDPAIQSYPVSTTSMNGGVQDGAIIAFHNGSDNWFYAQKLDMLGRPLVGPCGIRVDGPIDPTDALRDRQIVSTSNGDALFVYLKQVGYSKQVFAKVIHYDPQVYDPDDPQVDAPPVQLSTLPGDSAHIRIAPSGGNFIVTWDKSKNIYAQKVNRSAQKLWGPTETVVCDNPLSQYDPEILADGHEGVYIVFLDARDLTRGFNLYAQRLDEDGNRLWAPDGNPIYLQPPQDTMEGGGDPPRELPHYVHKMARSAPENFVVTHPHEESLGILAEGVNGDGDVQWRKVVGPHLLYGTEENPVIISDGANGVCILWEERLTPYVKMDIYGSRIDQNGNPIWGARAISSTGGADKHLSFAAIPNGVVLQSSTIIASWSFGSSVLNANLLKLSNGCPLFDPPFVVSTGAIPAPPLSSVNLLGSARLIVYQKAGDILARFIPAPPISAWTCPEK